MMLGAGTYPQGYSSLQKEGKVQGTGFERLDLFA